jgi:hypothetical protein
LRERPRIRTSYISSGSSQFSGKRGGRIVRYFFHVRNTHHAYDDLRGETLSGVDEARIQAAIIASEIAQDADWIGFSVLVTDERGAEIVRLPVADAMSRSPRIQ